MFQGFENSKLGTIKLFWIKSIYANFFFRKLVKSKKFDIVKLYIDLILPKEMVSSPETFDVLKYGKMTKLTQTKQRFEILAWFTHNIAYQTGFENSTGNTKHIWFYFFERIYLLQAVLSIWRIN